MFNVEIVNYLKNYTETAAIEKDELVLTSGTASNGLRCVDSNGDRFVNLILRNPQGFVLKSEDQRIEINEALTGAGYTPATVPPPFIQQLSENRSALTVELSKQLLEKVDKGDYKDSTGKAIKDISFSITLIANVSGTIRTFGTYELKLMANSAPPDIKNAMLQLTENGSGQYILCFHLPKVKGTVHECDTKKIKIGSETYYFKDTGSDVDFYTDEGCTTPADSTKIATSYSGSLYSAVPGGITFSAPTSSSGYYPVYYFTETSMSADEIKYDIVLEDDFGLASSLGVSSKGEKLTAVIIPNETSYIGTEDGYCEIQLTHNGQTNTGDTVSGVTIYYNVEQGGNVVASGSGASGVKVKLPSGKKGYTINAIAKKPYFVESDESSQGSIDVQRSTIYYVSQNGNSPENGALGTKASPFRTIQQAVNDITTQATDFGEVLNGYTINLLSNITPDESDTFDASQYNAMVNITKAYKYTINGNGHTIDAKRDPSNQGRVINLPSTTNTVVINDVIIKGGICSTGAAGIYAEARNLVLNNVEITGNESANNFGAGILVAGKCEFKSGSVHDNTAKGGAGINLYSRGTLILGDSTNTSSCVKIYNNIATQSNMAGGCSISARDDGKDFIIYSAKIYDNYNINSGAHVLNNLKLASNVKIKVGGNLSGSKIGVTTENTPSSGSTIPITTGYSTYNDEVPPSKIFKSDAGYGVIMDEIDGQEVVLATGGGSIDVPSESYDDIKISVDKTVFLTKNTGNSLTVTSKVKSGTSYVDIPLNECTYSYELYNHGEKVNGIISTGSAKNIVNFNCASLPNESFELYVYLDYKGKKYQGVFPIEVYVGQGTPVTNSNEFKNALTAGGEIHLCKDTTVSHGSGYSNKITISKDCTIDGGGNELLMNYLFFTSDSPITVQFKNITLKSNDQLMLQIYTNATVYFQEGTVIDFDNKLNNDKGVFVNNGSTLYMEDGACIKNANGTAVSIGEGHSTFVMNGGEICNNTGTAIKGTIYSSVYINGGEIHHNKGDSIINIDGWSGVPYFKMTGGEIYSNIITFGSCNNSADRSGGAIRFTGTRTNSSGEKFIITGGKIYNNYAYNNGGAICLIACNASISGCEITNNVCGLYGAAIYNSNSTTGALDYRGTCTIDSSAIIKNNYVNADFDVNNPVYDQGTEDNNVYSGNYNDHRN